MNKFTKISAAVIASLALANLANAATPGAYMGLGLGASRAETPNSYMFSLDNAFTGTNQRQYGGLGGKVFAGYNFNRYVGLEASYATYAKSSYKATADGDSASLKYALSAFNLVGKAYLPFDDSGFNAYVLGGLSDVRNKVSYSNAGVDLADGITANFKPGTHTYSSIRPVYGVGMSYDIAQHVTTGLEFSHIQGKGNVKTSAGAIPSADLLTLNIGYLFN